MFRFEVKAGAAEGWGALGPLCSDPSASSSAGPKTGTTLRFGRSRVHAPGTERRYLVRLVVLGAVSIAAIFILSWPPPNQRGAGGRDGPLGEFETALAPSPFAELGAGLFVSDGRTGPARDSDDLHGALQTADDAPFALDRRLLEGLLDKTSGIPPLPYYHLVSIAAQTPPDVLVEHALPESEITFAHLWTEPEQHRGKLIYLKGHLRGLKRFDTTTNKELNRSGVATLYQGDMFTPAAHPKPYIIIVPSVPEGMPLGANLAENVTFAGFFLKLWRYKSADDIDRAAPLMIGRMITWTPAPRPDSRHRLSAYLAIAFVLLVACMGYAVWAINRGTLLGRRLPFMVAAGEADRSAVIADLARLEKTEPPDPIDPVSPER